VRTLRKRKDQNRSTGKEGQTINFDQEVLDKLKKLALQEDSTVSNVVNHVCRAFVLEDKAFFEMKARTALMDFYHYRDMVKTAEERKVMYEEAVAPKK